MTNDLRRRWLGRIAVGALLGGLALLSTGGYAADEPVRVRGTIASLEGTKLVVHGREGSDVTVALTPKYAVFAVVKASKDDIKKGTFIGTATLPGSDKSLKSLELVVFPESLRGFAEGHYSWDLKPKSMMTNATVSNMVTGTDGQKITVTYKGGEKTITVPPDAPIVALVAATQADLKPGVSVFVPAKRDGGAIKSGAVLFGKDGVKPPM